MQGDLVEGREKAPRGVAGQRRDSWDDRERRPRKVVDLPGGSAVAAWLECRRSRGAYRGGADGSIQGGSTAWYPEIQRRGDVVILRHGDVVTVEVERCPIVQGDSRQPEPADRRLAADRLDGMKLERNKFRLGQDVQRAVSLDLACAPSPDGLQLAHAATGAERILGGAPLSVPHNFRTVCLFGNPRDRIHFSRRRRSS